MSPEDQKNELKARSHIAEERTKKVLKPGDGLLGAKCVDYFSWIGWMLNRFKNKD